MKLRGFSKTFRTYVGTNGLAHLAKSRLKKTILAKLDESVSHVKHLQAGLAGMSVPRLYFVIAGGLNV